MSPLEELRHALTRSAAIMDKIDPAIAGPYAMNEAHRCRDTITALDALIAERDALREALKPFAEAYSNGKYTNYPAKTTLWEDCAVTAGDLRRAHAALNQPHAGGKADK